MALTTVPASLSATALTLTTAAQPNITSVGTLTGLTVSGNIAGTLTTAAQTNITSLGTLTSLTTSGSVGIKTTAASGVALDIRENSTTTAVDIRNANASGYGLYVAGGSSSSQYALRAADKDNNALFSVMGNGNVGIGVTPSTLWSSSYEALQIGLGASIAAHNAAGNAMKIGSNMVYEGTAPNYYDKYLTSATAAKYELDVHGHKWYYAASGTAGNAISWNEAMRIADSGQVGINSAGTAATLQVTAKSGTTGQLVTGAAGNNIATFARSTGQTLGIKELGSTSFELESSTSLGYDVGSGYNHEFYVAGAAKVKINSSGNIGIGGGHSETRRNLGLVGSTPGVVFHDSNVTNLQHEIVGGGNAGLEISADFNNVATGYIRFDVGGGTKMRIEESGNVGIGTANNAPLTKFHVHNGSDAENILIVTGADTTTEYIALGTSGGVGVLKSGNSASATGGNPLAFETAASNGAEIERMRIDGSGNVGIGTQNPTEKLEVAGNIKITNVSGSSSRLLLPNFWIGPVPNTANNNNGAVLLVNLTTINASNVGFQFSGSIIGNSYTGQAYVNVNIVKHYNNDNVAFDMGGRSSLTSTVTRMQLRLCTVTYSGNSYLAIVKVGGGTGTIQLNGYLQGWDASVITEVASGTYTVTTNHGNLNF